MFGTAVAAGLIACYFIPSLRTVRLLPDVLRASELSRIQNGGLNAGAIFGVPTAEVSGSGDERLPDTAETSYTFRLFNVFPLRTVRVLPDGGDLLQPGGTAVGITILTDGALVVGLGSVETPSGKVSPGAAAGVVPGDRIIKVDGETVMDADSLAHLFYQAGGEVLLTVERGGQELTLTARPERLPDGTNKLGIWVRDSTAGVGTISFVDTENRWFAALGHAVSDVDTHSALTIREGHILPSTIVDIIPGAQGEPGELSGVFSKTGDSLGRIERNTAYGIFGPMSAAYENGFCGPVPLGHATEAHTGPAKLLSTISGDGVTAYECEIIRVSDQTAPATKGMVVLITDQALLSRTGGIVQGMSGSPVLQDGRLIGVVTHVFVNDPTRGYCVYAEWMQDILSEAAAQ